MRPQQLPPVRGPRRFSVVARSGGVRLSLRGRFHPPFYPGGYQGLGPVGRSGERAQSFADPAFEPTDEQLFEMSRQASAHMRAAREDSLQKMRQEIIAARKAALERLARVRSGRK